MRTLEGKVAVITGAGSGIGRALAFELCRTGCKVALCDINPQNLQETAELLPENSQYFIKDIDCANQEQVKAFASEASSYFGQIDILINNAGVSLTHSVTEGSIEEMEWLININFWGVVYGTKAFLPHLQTRDEAHIVNVGSVFGVMAAPNQAAYCASKFAVRGFTESLSQELRHSNINVSCAYPGGIKTNLIRNSRFHEDSTNLRDREEAAEKFEELATTTPERAAQVIINGILNKRQRILIGSDSRFIDWIVRLFPGTYDYFLNKTSDNWCKDSRESHKAAC
ncbi:SDR family NAD(P)-dependent oxidoreductase [Parendozoicomonas haliclonae]|uniref:Putative oxidoreductase SadH n=1 Tax=Parendozoicomonas haliclonae TaxID=1960125 RepID=A0A1X7AF46_9GAMM|nr:SDR family oxidoreductase [Parendozoicomonas haliclonae]SMA36394.1 putative oxidoreductase SadH [Parendozoicomonas haliclonae]